MVGRAVVVVGGGIAATSCVEALFEEFREGAASLSQVLLVAPSRVVNSTANYQLLGRRIESFDVVEREPGAIPVPAGLEFRFIEASVEEFNLKDRKIGFRRISQDKQLDWVGYDALCLCLGASPRQTLADGCLVTDRTVVIRDRKSIAELQAKLATCRRVLIVGNGGIGLELAHRITNCDRVWLVRDESIGANFLDAAAAKFLLENARDPPATRAATREEFSSTQSADGEQGPALGPHWRHQVSGSLRGCKSDREQSHLQIIHNDQVKLVEQGAGAKDEQSRLCVTTEKGARIECDLIVLGIGVVPNTDLLRGRLELDAGSDGGVVIDQEMRTSASQVYAAGDVVSCKRWTGDNLRLWFQMRLWTQARSMGLYAGRCIAAHLAAGDPSIHFNFECFTHCTWFFNQRVILLGRHNQELRASEVLVRVNPPRDYVKVLLDGEGRIFGAVLIGESGLEETLENLIHDAIDVRFLKERLLDDTLDIDDYFD